MRSSLVALLSLGLSSVSLVSAGAYKGCQQTRNACPSGTVFVKPGANLQTAVDTAKFVWLAAGDYNLKQQLLVTKDVTLLGEIRSDGKQARIIWSASSPIGGSVPNRDSATLFVKSKGFFNAYNLALLNTKDDGLQKGVQPSGPAAAFYSSPGSTVGLYQCDLFSWQDTFFAGGRAFLRGGSITGSVDMLYGQGRAWLQSTNIFNRACGGAIAAWDSASYDGALVVQQAGITRAPDAIDRTSKCFLGRPWRPQSVVGYFQCDLGEVIDPAGWRTWKKGDPPGPEMFREYKNTGRGGVDVSKRQLGRQLTDAEAYDISISGFFNGSIDWIDSREAQF